MAKLNKLNPLAATVGAAFMAGALSAGTVNASENPFVTTDLGSGYQVADGHMEGKCGEGKCGEDTDKDKGKEGTCGEDKGKEGSCGDDKGKEGKCGEGKCGGSA